jgi:hypothetical protein
MAAIAEILAPGTSTPVDDDARVEGDPDKLGVADLVTMFEDAEAATLTARRLSERDRDYYDHIQLTAEELKVLKKRGQPPVIANAICRKINYLVGLEKEQRVKPKAMPRTPAHEQDADSATEALRYVIEAEDYGHKRSAAWKNILIEGACGFAVAVKPSKYKGPQPTPFGQQLYSGQVPAVGSQPQYDVEIRRIAWDRMFADPHSAEPDYSDATYLGVVVWMDLADAVKLYGDATRDILDSTIRDAGQSTTYDDTPKFRLWADKKRKRIRVVQIWLKRGEEWHFAEFTKTGILKAGPSPYVTDTGESDCELVYQGAYVNRENERYGEVRGMISPQDEKNKRRSKALHALNTTQIVYEDGAVDDVEKTRRETARPDGSVKVNSGFFDKFKFETRSDLAQGQFELLQETNREMDLAGPNATQLGDKTQGSNSASGKAIIASQQGGMIQMGDLLDNLRHLDVRVFRKVWYRIRQYWTAEKWIRVTDDERNIKWVGINTNMEVVKDPQTGQVITRPRVGPDGQPLPPTRIAELDCDITIDDAPDTVTPQLEQWQSLNDLAKAGVPIPPDALIEAAPNLKNKDKIIERMQQPNPQAAMQQQMQQLMQQLQLSLGQSKLQETQARTADITASADLKRANAAKVAHEIMTPEQPTATAPEPADPLAGEQALADLMNTVADTDLKRANTALVEGKTRQTAVQTHLAPAQFAASRQDAAAARTAQPPRTLQ